MTEYYVYSHTRKDNGKCFYIGKGKGKRAFSSQTRNNHWRNTVKKAGGFDTNILVNNITEEKALELEASFIKQLGLNNLTNQTPGGDYNPMSSLEFRKKLGKAKSKPVLQFNLDGQFIKEWPNQKVARKEVGEGVWSVLHGRQKTAQGYIWKYKE